MQPSKRIEIVRRWLGITAVGAVCAWVPPCSMAAESPAPLATSRSAIEPAAPVVPAEVVAAMQGGDYDTARRALIALREKAADRDDGAYFAFLQAVAERLAGKRDPARESLRAAIAASPDGRWAPKLRFELAAIELAAGNLAAVEDLTRGEAARLLRGPRKDQLAGVYQTFAQKLLEPADPLVRPDPNAAYELLAQARDLAESAGLRAELLFAMGRASLAGGNPPRAIENFTQYLRDHAEGHDRFAVRFQKGEAERKANQMLAARLTWADLARDIDRRKPDDRSPALAAIRADALYAIASTFGVPAPPDDSSLSQGVAALRRFLAAFPAHPDAVRAAFSIGESYRVRGKSSDAIDAFAQFLKGEHFKIETDSARRDWGELAMTASFHVGEIRQGQQKFAEAIAAWKGYLANYPSGPQSADAQRAILDTQLMVAADHDSAGRHAEARAAWSEFATQNPLDSRIPQVLFQIGESLVREKQVDQAMAAWEPLSSRFPMSEPAAHAQFLTAGLLENEKGDPAQAIERFKKIAVEPWASQARARVAVMEAKALVVVTPRTFRSGEAAHLTITTRNIETLSFAAYRLSAEAYFRKKNMLDHVESLDIGLVSPDVSWTTKVAGHARYKPVESDYKLEKINLPGVYVVKVTDDKTLQATTLVIGSDLDAIVKSSHDQVLVFAQDMKTGRGRGGARVLISDGGQVALEGVTGADGVLIRDWQPPRSGDGRLNYLIIDGPDVAGSALGMSARVAVGLTPRAYIYTDRPAYRPGQKVSIRGVIREIDGGQYANVPQSEYRLEVADSRGRLIAARSVRLSEFGTFHDSLSLDPSAPAGAYRVRVYRPGKSDFAGAFQVESYQLEPIDLAFDFKKTVFYRGETVAANLIARYQYGAPLASRPIDVELPDGRVLHGKTDPAGNFPFEFPTDGFAEQQALRVAARLPEDNVAALATVVLAVRGFEIGLSTSRDVYLDGESFETQVVATDAHGEPAGESLTASVIKLVNTHGRVNEREIERKPLATEPKTGRGAVRFKVDDPHGGRYLVRVAGADRFGNTIIADRVLTISGKSDLNKLRILADRQRYKVGEEASVNLHSRDRAGTALLTWEADRILSYRIVMLKEGDNAVAWGVDGAEFPNFTLTATRMWRSDCDQAKLDIQVERDLRLTVAPVRPVVGPGEPVELDVTAVDQLGRPVRAELSIAMVDQSLLRLFHDPMPAIGAFFYNQTRTGAFETQATNMFRYAPPTVPVSQAVVDDAERTAAAAANEESRRGVLDQAQFSAIAPPAAPASNAPAGGRGHQMGGAAPARFGKSFMRREVAAAGLLEKDKGGDAVDGLDVKCEVSRTRFAETAYWNPLIVTGTDGKARVTFKAPTALSSYRITARGITGQDTLAGQTTSALSVRKNFSVDLKLPSSLTQGDKPRFIATIHHTELVGKASLRLSIYAGGRDEVFPRTIDLKRDGVDEVLFEPLEVPECDSVRLTLAGSIGAASDEIVVEVPVRPWGVQVVASESGTSTDSSTIFVGIPAGRAFDHSEMSIVVSPSFKRMLIELALGEDAFTIKKPIMTQPARLIWPPCDTTADRAADLLAATGALEYLRSSRAAVAPEGDRLTDRIARLASSLISAQNQDGGWLWVSGGQRAGAGQNGTTAASDRLSSAAVVWALASAENIGLLTDPRVLDNAVAYLTQEFARTSGNDHETRAALLHALSTRRAAGFEAANSLNRVRNELSDPALAYLALTFANLDRASLAGELIGILAPRAKTEAAAPGRPGRVYWSNFGRSQAIRGAVETTALVTLAFTRVRPQARELDGAVAWLLARRSGAGWQPRKAKGPALAALGSYYGRAQGADDHYKLTVAVNESEVAVIDVVGSTEGQAIAVPSKALKPGQQNRVRFTMEGRGRYGYAVTMSGFSRDFKPEQDSRAKVASIVRRVYYPAAPELEGKALPVGFGVVVNARPFENLASRVALGGRARVALTAWRSVPDTTPEWERDFLIVTEHVPAGATLIDGSVQSDATSYRLADGVLTFYFAPTANPGVISYDIHGYMPGEYRALPAMITSAYEPGRFHLGPVSGLRVLAPGEPNADPYKPTPDELYARGKAHFDAGRFDDASRALEPLFAGYTLREDIGKDAARMLLLINISAEQPRKIVQYFEIVKEKVPELVISFDRLLAIGKAYREINEYERAAIVWRGLIEASYLEDARVGELLRQRGKPLEAIAYLIELWRAYPNTASIESDFFGLSQVVAQTASQASGNAALRRELAAAGVSPSELLLQSVRMIQTFLSQSPRSPIADEASLALVGAFTDLGDFKAVDRLASRFAGLYPRSNYQDSFQYSVALANFHLGQYDRAIEVAQSIARATYKDVAGVEQPSPNKWQALYILGQIHDARRQPAKALEYYRQVADRFSDAAGAVLSYTRKELKVPEVSVIRGDDRPKVADQPPRAGQDVTGFRTVEVAAAGTGSNRQPPGPSRPGIGVDYRNIAQVDVKVYPVDLMQLYLTRRNLNGIAGIDLAGVTPLVEKTITLGGGADYDDKTKAIELPLSKDGAYLAMIRGDNLYASGIVLVTPMELEVLEEPAAGRVRITACDARSREFLPKVQVKVSGGDTPSFVSGETDLRGVFVAEGLRGPVTVIARKEVSQYAFYRGTQYVGAPVPPAPVSDAAARPPGQAAAADQSLDANLKIQNDANSLKQIERLQQRYAAPADKSKGAQAGGFR